MRQGVNRFRKYRYREKGWKKIHFEHHQNFPAAFGPSLTASAAPFFIPYFVPSLIAPCTASFFKASLAALPPYSATGFLPSAPLALGTC